MNELPLVRGCRRPQSAEFKRRNGAFRRAVAVPLVVQIISAVLVIALAGAAGMQWWLQPRPHWTVNLGRDRAASFVGGPGARNANNPLWLLVEGRSHESEESTLCIDPNSGVVVNRVTPSSGAEYTRSVLKDGRLLMTAMHDPGPAVNTQIEIYDAQSSSPVLSRRIAGRCQVAGGGRLAWRTAENAARLLLEAIDLKTGAVAAAKSFPADRYMENGCILHDDAFVAVHLESPHAPGVPDGVEIWDLKRDRRLAVASFPSLAAGVEDLYVSGPWFSDSGDEVETYVWDLAHGPRLARVLVLDLKSGRLIDKPVGPYIDPPNAGDGTIVSCIPRADGSELWTAERREPYSFWWCLQRNGRVVSPWTASPFSEADASRLLFAWKDSPYDSSEHRVYERGRSVGGLTATRVEPAGSRGEFVVQTVASSAWRSTPQQVRQLAPWGWQAREKVARFHWHDRAAGDWREMGCPPNADPWRLHGRDLLTVSKLTGCDTLLQAWPLPALKRPGLPESATTARRLAVKRAPAG